MTVPGGKGRHWAERLARRHLEGLGWTILAANYAARQGELDLVARDGATVVFVEVRQRRSPSHGHPAETLDRRKRARWRSMALRYLARELGQPDAPARFDAVLVLGDEAAPRLTHLRDVL